MRARVLSSIGLSLALHAGGLVALSFVGVRGVADASTSQVALVNGFEVADLPRGVLVPLEVIPPPEPPPAPEELKPAPPPPPPMDEELDSPLGIEDGHENAEAWKGAREATENLAPKSKVDQAARAIDPKAGQKDAGPEATQSAAGSAVAEGPGAKPGAPGEAHASAPASEPPVVQTQAVQPQEKQEQPRQPEPEQLKPQQPEARQPEPVAPGPEDKAKGEVELPRPQEKPQQLDEQQPAHEQREKQQEKAVQPLEQQLKPAEPESTRPAEDASKAADANDAPRTPTNPGDGGGGAVGISKANSPEAQPGKKADEESPAASVVGSLVFRPGEPLAAKGLRVWTVTPKYAITTRYLARPKNPVVLITFGRDGKVKKAVFKERTGYEDVDKPLLEAVYRWTARGEALTKLPPENPTAGVTYSIKFLMDSD